MGETKEEIEFILDRKTEKDRTNQTEKGERQAERQTDFYRRLNINVE